MRVLITGHTGFKGAWMSTLLARRGHQVSGIALDPLAGSLFEKADVSALLENDVRLDIRDAEALRRAVSEIGPSLVIHMAAQPLVRQSYLQPRETFETNVMGTFNVLEAISAAPQVRGSVIVTTDKVYRNVGRAEGYREDDALGGDDPYSSSKAMADILTHSWRTSFPSAPVTTARAGNVIGGGDVSKDRLLVDLIQGFSTGQPVAIRYPDAVRPWQHVLDCIAGYLSLAAAMLDGRAEGNWNFGPDPESFQTVREIADASAARWGRGASWIDDGARDHLHEAHLLTLDSSRAGSELAWHNHIGFPSSLDWTVDWFKAVSDGEDPVQVTNRQIDDFVGIASESSWMRTF